MSLTNLKGLDCSNNQLSSLDVSNCLNLQNLDCIQNQLSSIDDNVINNKFIERGSKCEIGKVPWAGLTLIFNDLNINIKTNISVKDKLKMGILPETKKTKKNKKKI